MPLTCRERRGTEELLSIWREHASDEGLGEFLLRCNANGDLANEEDLNWAASRLFEADSEDLLRWARKRYGL